MRYVAKTKEEYVKLYIEEKLSLDYITISDDLKEETFLYIKMLCDENPKDGRYSLLLAECYYDGMGVMKDFDEAIHWNTIAAELGSAEAQRELGYHYDWAPLDEEECNEKALYWYRKAAEQDDEWALYYLGGHYRRGEGVPEDFKKALELYTKSAELGCIDAQEVLGDWYYSGEDGVTKNLKKAIHLYEQLAEQEDMEIQSKLAICYLEDESDEERYEKAFPLLRETAEFWNTESMYHLGVLYEKGEGTPKDYKSAMYWYATAGANGHQKAIERLEIELEKVRQKGTKKIVSSKEEFVKMYMEYDILPDEMEMREDLKHETFHYIEKLHHENCDNEKYKKLYDIVSNLYYGWAWELFLYREDND